MEETTLNNDIHTKLTEKFGEKVTAVSEPYGLLTFVTYLAVSCSTGNRMGGTSKKCGCGTNKGFVGY